MYDWTGFLATRRVIGQVLTYPSCVSFVDIFGILPVEKKMISIYSNCKLINLSKKITTYTLYTLRQSSSNHLLNLIQFINTFCVTNQRTYCEIVSCFSVNSNVANSPSLSVFNSFFRFAVACSLNVVVSLLKMYLSKIRTVRRL